MAFTPAFDPASAASPLGKFFVETFKAEYGQDPDFYAANYDEDTLAMWDLIRRVLAKSGDINSAEQLDAALRDKPSFTSVYGGDATTNGTIDLDLQTHTVTRRTMGVFTYKDKKVTPHAFFDLNGADYGKVD